MLSYPIRTRVSHTPTPTHLPSRVLPSISALILIASPPIHPALSSTTLSPVASTPFPTPYPTRPHPPQTLSHFFPLSPPYTSHPDLTSHTPHRDASATLPFVLIPRNRAFTPHPSQAFVPVRHFQSDHPSCTPSGSVSPLLVPPIAITVSLTRLPLRSTHARVFHAQSRRNHLSTPFHTIVNSINHLTRRASRTRSHHTRLPPRSHPPPPGSRPPPIPSFLSPNATPIYTSCSCPRSPYFFISPPPVPISPPPSPPFPPISIPPRATNSSPSPFLPFHPHPPPSFPSPVPPATDHGPLPPPPPPTPRLSLLLPSSPHIPSRLHLFIHHRSPASPALDRTDSLPHSVLVPPSINNSTTQRPPRNTSHTISPSPLPLPILHSLSPCSYPPHTPVPSSHTSQIRSPRIVPTTIHFPTPTFSSSSLLSLVTPHTIPNQFPTSPPPLPSHLSSLFSSPYSPLHRLQNPSPIPSFLPTFLSSILLTRFAPPFRASCSSRHSMPASSWISRRMPETMSSSASSLPPRPLYLPRWASWLRALRCTSSTRERSGEST